MLVKRLIPGWLILLCASLAHGAAGDVDAGFGTGGYFAPGPAQCCGIARGNAVAVQPDGKIVVAGYAHDGYSPHAAIVRLNAAGSVDSTFGSSGLVRLPIGTVL